MQVTHDDIHLIESVNSFRVRVGVAQFAHGSGGGAPSWGLRVRITSHLSAVSFSTYDPVRIGVRRSLLVSDRHRDGGTGGWLAPPVSVPPVQCLPGMGHGAGKRRRSGGMG